MTIIDANLLVYAHVTDMPQHKPALTWLDGQLNGGVRVGLPWASLLGFVRLVSNPRIFEKAEPVSTAWTQVEEWLACPNVWIPQPTERHQAILGLIIENSTLSANLVPDAHLAALAMEHGLTLCSTDGDFARFKDLRWTNPIAK